MRRVGPDALARGLLLSVVFASAGCPNQELASLDPCSISAASIRVEQGGVSEVDLLFVIDNSGSMATEQVKLAKELPRLVSVLTSGDRFHGRDVPEGTTDAQRFFTKVSSLHIGVVSSSMHVMDSATTTQVNVKNCMRDDDDGKLLNRTEIAKNGVFDGKLEVLAPDGDCQDVGDLPPYQTYQAGESDAEDIGRAFSCTSRLGTEGCPFEQQLEAMWKAVAPSNGKDPELHQFLYDERGHGAPDGYNEGFVRDGAVLAVIQVSDEEDCSIQEAGKELFALGDSRFRENVNLRCGIHANTEDMLWPTARYVEGLKSLKPDNPDHVIFAAIVGIPVDAIGQPLAEVLERDEMQFRFDSPGDNEPHTSCTRVSATEATPDKAFPPRRFVEVAQGFEENGVVYSICADDYAPALNTLIDRIASKLGGNCLPRQLTPDETGKVRCDVFELLAPKDKKCVAERGHVDDDGKLVAVKQMEVRNKDGKLETHRGCRMQQVAVHNEAPDEGRTGWYYDDFSIAELQKECEADARQRVMFSFGELPAGAGAVIECVAPVVRIDPHALGLDAVNTRCSQEAKECAERSNGDEQGGYDLVCIENTCQIQCKSNPDCPPSWVCGGGKGMKFCQQPTCPKVDAEPNSGASPST